MSRFTTGWAKNDAVSSLNQCTCMGGEASGLKRSIPASPASEAMIGDVENVEGWCDGHLSLAVVWF